MPILELKSLEKLPKKKPFKFLSGVFRRGTSEELEVTEDMLYGTDAWRDRESPEPDRSNSAAGHLDIEEEMENLHLSRRQRWQQGAKYCCIYSMALYWVQSFIQEYE